MDKFQIVKNCGDGTYGLVMEAYNKTNREFVAIKKMKKTFDTWDECMALREVRTLRKLNHPNVVKLKEVIRVHKDLYLVFEFMKGTVLDLIKTKSRLSNGIPIETILDVTKQCLKGIGHCHDKGYFHRDLKPENLLYSDGNLKICDFGSSKESFLKNLPCTHYVSTRWYRSPEIILRERFYNEKVDIWAMGCILAELFTGTPLLPGQSETDMIMRLSKLIGTIPQTWEKGIELMNKKGVKFMPGTLVEPNKDQIL